jgi:hypothetical protein
MSIEKKTKFFFGIYPRQVSSFRQEKRYERGNNKTKFFLNIPETRYLLSVRKKDTSFYILTEKNVEIISLPIDVFEILH